MEREHIEADGVIVGHMTDETPQRAFYRRWKAMMCGDRRCRSSQTAARGKDFVSGRVVAIMAKLSRSDAEDILYNEARMLDERRYR